MKNTSQRNGIAGAGNWIVDNVKVIDRLPARGMLGNILSETRGTGGAAFNTLVDLARMGTPFPLYGIGVIGDDSSGEFIRRTCCDLGIDMAGLITLENEATAYTDVMTEKGTTERSYYYRRGANARFGIEHVPLGQLTCRIFHLGYLLLLDGLDQPDMEYGTVAARLLHMVQNEGIKTSVDVVSEDSDRFGKIVPASLRHTDYLILNEIETGRTTGHKVRNAQGQLDATAVVDAVEALFAMGRMELVVVHMPEGAYLRTRDGRRFSRGSLSLPPDFIKGTAGAGDAFCAGMLYGLHEAWDYMKAMRLGAAAAAACLTHPSTTDGMLPFDQVMELSQRFPERPAPVKV
ncbi:MAG: carbohydrate kinase family protein [Verrucomicrobia bacterium]|nr:carbohydrate kinase family protein [Verrucomicrobiota bacterium]